MRFLIVEDEYFARKALCQSVREWSQEAEIREAENGMAALRLIECEVFDVLLLDIRMPVMDGLTLARLALERLPDVYTIMITGYGDFENTRAALRASARDYLLKPVDDDRLCEALMRAQEDHQRMVRARLDKLRQLRGEVEMRDELLQLQLAHWLAGEGGGPPDDALRRLNGRSHCMVMLIAAQRADVHARICDALPPGALHTAMGSELAVLIGYTSPRPWAQRAEAPRKLSARLSGESVAHRIAVSALHPLMDAPQALAQARAMLNYRLLRDEPVLAVEDRVEPARYMSALDMDAARLYQAMEQGREAEALAIVSGALRAVAAEPNASLTSLADVLNRVGACVNRVQALSMGMSAGDAMLMCDEIRMEDAREFGELANMVEAAVRRACRLRERTHVTNADEVVRQLVRHIHEHYAENISLKELAESRFFLNASYLSRLFKAGTGESFRQYLTDVRLGKARHMLLNGDISVMRVASECGYSDASQFIELFRKRYGVTPGVWRSRPDADD